MGIFSKKTKDQPKKDEKAKSAKLVVDKEVKPEEKKAKKIKTEKNPVVKKEPIKKISKVKSQAVEQKAYRILIRPIISEKATIGVSANKYVFAVAPSANKVEVKKAVEEIYKVVPQSVNIINKAGKRVRFGRNFGATKNVKKAIVTLKKGDTIKLYEGI